MSTVFVVAIKGPSISNQTSNTLSQLSLRLSFQQFPYWLVRMHVEFLVVPQNLVSHVFCYSVLEIRIHWLLLVHCRLVPFSPPLFFLFHLLPDFRYAFFIIKLILWVFSEAQLFWSAFRFDRFWVRTSNLSFAFSWFLSAFDLTDSFIDFSILSSQFSWLFSS